MRSSKDLFWAIILLWVAGGIQFGVIPSLTNGFFQPDVLLVTMCVVNMFAVRAVGATFGFLSGVMMGAITGVNMATHTVIRTLAGGGISWIARSDVERSPSSAALITGITSAVVQLLMLFIAPKQAIGVALLATIFSAVVNGVLAWPIFALANRLLDPARK